VCARCSPFAITRAAAAAAAAVADGAKAITRRRRVLLPQPHQSHQSAHCSVCRPGYSHAARYRRLVEAISASVAAAPATGRDCVVQLLLSVVEGALNQAP